MIPLECLEEEITQKRPECLRLKRNVRFGEPLLMTSIETGAGTAFPSSSYQVINKITVVQDGACTDVNAVKCSISNVVSPRRNYPGKEISHAKQFSQERKLERTSKIR